MMIEQIKYMIEYVKSLFVYNSNEVQADDKFTEFLSEMDRLELSKKENNESR